jgi:hypothetical protein
MLNSVDTMLKKASILEKESMIALLMIFDVQLTLKKRTNTSSFVG